MAILPVAAVDLNHSLDFLVYKSLIFSEQDRTPFV